MNKAVDSVAKNESVTNHVNTCDPGAGLTFSLLPAAQRPLATGLQGITGETSPLVSTGSDNDQAAQQLAPFDYDENQASDPSPARDFAHDFSKMSVFSKTSMPAPGGGQFSPSAVDASAGLAHSRNTSESGFSSDHAETPAGYFAPLGLSYGPLPIVSHDDQTEIEARRAGELATESGDSPLPSGSVRLHTGPAAERLAGGLRARAITVGSDIIFGQGEYAPHTASGRALLAHEMTHVSQQARTGPRVALEGTDSFAPFESEGSRRAREFARLTISVVEDALLATLRREGANAFLRQLQRQSLSDRRLLRQRSDFVTAVRAALRGYDLWNAETLLGIDAEQKESLAHTTSMVNPFLSTAEQETEARGARMAEDFRLLTFSIVRDPLLEALRQHNSIAFLRELRALSREDRQVLETDSTFLAEIRRYFHGTSRWIVRRILRFGPRFADLPVPVRELGWAVRDRDTTRVRDLLRAFPDLRSEQRTPGVRELLEYEFRRSPDLTEIRRVLTQGESGRGDVSRMTESAHYDRPSGGGALQVRAYGGTRRFTVARTASEIRVIVRIRFVHTTISGTTATKTNRTYHVPDSNRNEWRQQIDAAWNRRFRAESGAIRLPIVFAPVFTDSNPHYTVGIVDREEYFRSNMTTWWLHRQPSRKTAAHEFGHMLGAADEYNLPGTTAEIPASLGLNVDERQRSSVEGVLGTARAVRVGGYDLPGIMGSSSEEGAAGLPRHLWLVREVINSEVRNAGEARFRITRL